jgi:hypothetical protein
MPTRRFILLVFASGVLGIVLYVVLSHPREPSYNGRSLSSWLERFHTPEGLLADPPEAGDAIRHMGTNAVPFLLECLRYEGISTKSRFFGAIRDLLRRCGIASDTPAGQTRAFHAQCALIALGSNANIAVPELVRLMNDTNAPRTAYSAAIILTSIGTKEAFPAVLTVLTNQQHLARVAVALNMHRMRTNALPAVPALVQCLHDPETFVRHGATNALREIAPEALTNAPPK